MDDIVYYYTFDLDMSDLPGQTAVGAVLVPDNSGKFTMTDLTMAEYRIQRKKEIGKKKSKERQSRRSR